MRLFKWTFPACFALTLAATACDAEVEVESALADEHEISSALGGVDPVACPSEKPWTGVITMTETGFSPPRVRVAIGHILMFAPPAGSDDEMVADDGSFHTERELDGAQCLKFTRAGAYPYHAELSPETRGVIEIH